MGAKLAVLVGAAALLGVVAQARWLAMAGILAPSPGRRRAAGRLLGRPAADPGPRGVCSPCSPALLGFGLTNLVRNTGAALGIGFVYLAIVENAVRALRPSGSRGC